MSRGRSSVVGSLLGILNEVRSPRPPHEDRPRARRPRSAAAIKRKPVLEKDEQQQSVKLLRSIGWSIYVFGTHRKQGDHQGTMQTPGIADVLLFSPLRDGQREVLWLESKAKGGKLSAVQEIFRDLCREARLSHVTGGYNALVAWLLAHGYVRESSIPYYRLPAAAGSDSRKDSHGHA